MIRNFLENEPCIKPSVYVDEAARVIGRVTLEEDVSIWPMAVLRGDESTIHIGKCTNIQDGAIIHGSANTVLGEYVSVGHGAIVHGAKIGNNVLVGMGSTVIDNAVIGDNCIIGAGALVTGGKVFEEGSLIIGSPAKVVRKLSQEEIDSIRGNANIYLKLKKEYKNTLIP